LKMKTKMKRIWKRNGKKRERVVSYPSGPATLGRLLAAVGAAGPLHVPLRVLSLGPAASLGFFGGKCPAPAALLRSLGHPLAALPLATAAATADTAARGDLARRSRDGRRGLCPLLGQALSLGVHAHRPPPVHVRTKRKRIHI
jgi:hypothetical protein